MGGITVPVPDPLSVKRDSRGNRQALEWKSNTDLHHFYLTTEGCWYTYDLKTTRFPAFHLAAGYHSLWCDEESGHPSLDGKGNE